MTENTNDIGLYLFAGIVVLFIFIILMFALGNLISRFSRQLRYINGEIGRTSGAEQKYWIREKKRLWLSLIPFVKY